MGRTSINTWYEWKYCKACKQKTSHTIKSIYYYGSRKTKIIVYCKRCGNRYAYFKR